MALIVDAERAGPVYDTLTQGRYCRLGVAGVDVRNLIFWRTASVNIDVFWYRCANVSEEPAASCLRVHTVTDLRSSFVSEDPAQVEFCASRNLVRTWSSVYVFARKSRLNPNSQTLESDQPQHYRHYRHLRLIALSFPQGKIRRAFQKSYYSI
jgi:hypothetical protein